MKIDFTFEVLSNLLVKFKWAMKRDVFKGTLIAQEMMYFCSQITDDCLTSGLLKWRRRLYKIIALLSFDDVLDSYH